MKSTTVFCVKQTIIAFLVAILVSPVIGQSTGTINGQVTDTSHAAIASAAVTATNTETGVARSATTTPEGLYSFSALRPGSYQLKVDKSGFASTTTTTTVIVGTASTVNVELQVAGVTQSVEVTSQAPLVDVTQSDVAGTLRTQEVSQLPMLNRNFTGMVTLVPGARQAPILDTSKANIGAAIAVGGSEGRNLGLNVDGAENRDMLLGGPAMDYTLESIQEFKLLAHDYGAQYARSSGGVLEIATKSGTNALHGSAFAYGRNDAMTAIDYFTEQAGLPKNSYEREQFGGSFGGHIIKDRWFYFGAVERVRQDYVESEPTQAYNEAAILAAAVPSLGIIPAKTIPKPYRNTLYTLKTDYQATAHHALFVRWSQQNDLFNNDQLGVAQTLSGSTIHPDLSVPETDHHNIWSIVGSDNWVIGTTAVNQLLFQANHYTATLLGNHANQFRQLGFPSINTGANMGVDLNFIQDKYQVIDNYSHQLGRHSLKIGGNISWVPNFNIGANVLQSYWTNFTDDPSTIVSNKVKYPQGFATPGAAFLMFVGNLQGSPDGKVIPPLSNDTPIGYKELGAYIQDDFRMKPRLTVNLGLRYDVTLNGFDQQEAPNGRIYLALKAIGSPYGKLPSTPTRDFQPRFGLAWDVAGNGKDVVKLGFGVFRDNVYLADIWQSNPFLKATLTPYFTYINLPFLPPALNPLKNYVLGVGPLPPAPPLGITQLPPGRGTQGFVIDPTATDPYSLQYHAGYAHQITQDLVASVDFTHIQGVHEWRIHDLNPIEGAWDPNQGSIPTGTRRLAQRFQAALGDANILGPIKDETTANRSRYDELLLHVERRGTRVTLQATYTLSRADAFGGIAGGLTAAGTSVPEPLNTDQMFAPYEWGPTDTDERHRVVVSGVFRLPAGVELSPVLEAASARHYYLGTGTDRNGDGVLNRPLGDLYVDPATNQVVSMNAGVGEPTFDFDLRTTKTFNLWSESRKLALFAELFNITNRANFGNYFNGNASSKNFEKPIGYLPGFPTSRQLQLGGRFTF